VLEAGGHAGLFCAFNAGETVITLRAGGLVAHVPVTVQAGSVEQPCGTTHIKKPTPTEQHIETPTLKEEPVQEAPPTAAPPVPAPPAAVVPTPQAPRPATPAPPFVLPAPPVSPILAIVPVPVPTPARPTPPSGTSFVSSPVEAAQKEEEEEAAPESVSAEAVAYRQTEHEPSPYYLLGVIVLAAFAGASVRRRPGRRSKDLRIAPATVNTMRAQRRVSPRDRRW